MERRHLTKDIEALLGDYIGQRLRENGFDPKGKKGSTLLDDLAHYDLAVGVALTWLQKDGGRDLTKEDTRWRGHPGSCMYPNRLEREAMILSSFAGTLLKSLPVEDVLSLYKCKPSTTYLPKHAQSPIVHPFTLSSHPFAMLTAYKAVEHAKRHNAAAVEVGEVCVGTPRWTQPLHTTQLPAQHPLLPQRHGRLPARGSRTL
ncbi:uncharacterized protein C2orf80 isoform X2 [Amia ocellicauda]|uniref:uncharacterized protein C2orf80 isoform X2 n=1 Tax=Amia ocellicauda TaxID=2972642 RepID=UPI003463A871